MTIEAHRPIGAGVLRPGSLRTASKFHECFRCGTRIGERRARSLGACRDCARFVVDFAAKPKEALT